jgi:predicted RNase H-like nuclease (RuvC/YqgF family)
MAFNPQQFKQKKKRAVDPNAPPRPNLLSQDKKLRETTEAFSKLHDMVVRQQDEIASLRAKYDNMQESVAQILNYLRKGR